MFSITTQNVKSDNNFDPRMLKSYRSKEPKTREEYEKLQRKQRANIILDHYELLMKYALENKVSVPQTRRYFQNVSLGVPTEPIIKNWFPDRK